MSAKILAPIALLFAVGSAYAVSDAESAWQRALHEDAIYENAMYLFLRLAGVVWIGVEWVAAIVLWRTWRRLRAAAQARGLAR